MLTKLLILCAFIWLPILLYQVANRGFSVLVIFLLIAPVAANLINRPGFNPFFRSPQTASSSIESVETPEENNYLTDEVSLHMGDVLEPTRFLLVIFLLIFLLSTLQKGYREYPFDKTELFMCIFSLLALASAGMQSQRLTFALRVSVEAFIVPFFAYFVTSRLVVSEAHFRYLTRSMGYMGFYLIIICVIERFVHAHLLYRLGGPFYNDNTLHVVMSVVFFMMLLDVLCSKTLPADQPTLRHRVRCFVLYLSPIIILLTLTRGNWIAFILSISVFLLLGRRVLYISQKIGMVGVALLLIPLLIFGLQVMLPQELIEHRIANTSNIYGRWATWSVALQAGLEHPFFGIGLNNLRNVLQETYIQLTMVRSYNTVHNSFVSFFVELGAIGILVYLAMVGSMIHMGLRLYRTSPHVHDQWRGIAVIAVMVTYLVPALFSNTLYVIANLHHTYVYMFVGSIAGLNRRRLSDPDLYIFSGHPPRMRAEPPTLTL